MPNPPPGPARALMSTPDWKATRWALRTEENKLTDRQTRPGQSDRARLQPATTAYLLIDALVAR